ncbi:hypothetical protein [Bifidobacterium jacchi]|uniref:Uncharacterized protein n=1 Tax=Bifidobacterium jacchi TaxID=2490545 RepID=A0A5N5RHF4_9BIFI|nr:hypothetical protein [Bifidobacterium jacchi]KAB5606698.1 hypothetical protein EHS19_06810 [Bifidobacterium jacchi]
MVVFICPMQQQIRPLHNVHGQLWTQSPAFGVLWKTSAKTKRKTVPVFAREVPHLKMSAKSGVVPHLG